MAILGFLRNEKKDERTVDDRVGEEKDAENPMPA